MDCAHTGNDEGGSEPTLAQRSWQIPDPPR